MEPERYSHVTHLVSEVVGELRDGVTPFELLRACFPAGTVSGAPKVRAMQIISELEALPARDLRGRGRLLPAGDRRARHVHRDPHARGCSDGVAHLQAGGGIVADSDPAAEHEECLPSCARSRPRSSWQSRSRTPPRDPPDRQLRLVHVQPRAPVRGARSGGGRAAERRARRRRGGAARSLPSRRLARPRPPGRRRRDAARSSSGCCRRRRRSASASATRRSSRCCGGEVGYARELVHGKASPVRHDGSGLFAGLPDPFDGRALPLARRDAAAGRARADGIRGRRRGDGRAPPRAAGGRRPVPSRSRC